MSPLITFTTDYGTDSPYAAVIKGVILAINPHARLLDLSHAIAPQDLRHASYFLATAVPYFPSGTIHVCIIDPGVGSNRDAVYIEVAGQRLIGPDNGIFTALCRDDRPTCVRKLTDRRFWRSHVSDTFHGRDIFAPVAAHLSLGVDPRELGPEHAHLIELPPRSAVIYQNHWKGEVQFIDHFGNVITNIPADGVKSLPVKVAVNGEPRHNIRWVRTYSDAAPGDLVCLFSSDGFFEIAEVNGHAARRLGVKPGGDVEVEFA